MGRRGARHRPVESARGESGARRRARRLVGPCFGFGASGQNSPGDRKFPSSLRNFYGTFNEGTPLDKEFSLGDMGTCVVGNSRGAFVGVYTPGSRVLVSP